METFNHRRGAASPARTCLARYPIRSKRRSSPPAGSAPSLLACGPDPLRTSSDCRLRARERGNAPAGPEHDDGETERANAAMAWVSSIQNGPGREPCGIRCKILWVPAAAFGIQARGPQGPVGDSACLAVPNFGRQDERLRPACARQIIALAKGAGESRLKELSPTEVRNRGVRCSLAAGGWTPRCAWDAPAAVESIERSDMPPPAATLSIWISGSRGWSSSCGRHARLGSSLLSPRRLRAIDRSSRAGKFCCNRGTPILRARARSPSPSLSRPPSPTPSTPPTTRPCPRRRLRSFNL